MKAKILKRLDGKAIEKLRATLEKKRKNLVYVGFPRSVKTDEGFQMAMIAGAHEYGTKHIPERPFLKVAIVESQGDFKALNARNLKAFVNGKMSAKTALEQLGLMASARVKQKIVVGPFTPLSPETIRRKGSSKPLIDTGQMRQSVTYEIKDD